MLIISLLLLIGAAAPFPLIKKIADRLASDGTMERMTPSFWLPIRLTLLGTALLFAALWIWKKRSPDTFRAFFCSLGALPGRFCRDFKPFWRDFGKAWDLGTAERICFALIFLGGAVVRFLLLNRPLLHDEAYSMAIWGRSDMHFAVSDYHLPNNHLLNTVCINLIYHHLGKDVRMLRLPVFLSGTLLIAGMFLLAKKVFGKRTGFLAAGLCAFAPYLIEYSVNARGYVIQASLTVFAVLAAVYVTEHKNIFGWGMLILLSVLNFFTLPVALYPFGGICVWFLLRVLADRTTAAYNGRWNFFKYLITCGLLVSILTMLAYLPLFIHSGLNSFFGNIYVGAVPEAFIPTAIARSIDNFHAFTDTWPVFLWGMILLGMVLELISCRRIAYGHALLLTMAGIIAVQQPNLWPRTLTFLHPLIILYGAAFWVRLTDRLPHAKAAGTALTVILICCAAFSQFRIAVPQYGSIGTDEEAVRVLLKTEGENAKNIFFTTAARDNAPIWIYADIYGLPQTIFDKTVPFNRVYALYNPDNEAYKAPESLESLLETEGPGKNFFNRNEPEVLLEHSDGILYSFEIYPSAVQKAYGEVP